MPRFALTLLLLAVSIACQYDPFAHEFTRVKPNAEELVGLYELDDESIEMLRRHNLAPPSSRLVLQHDGTFEISHVPTCWREASECSSALEGASGTWQVVKENEWWVVRLHLLKIRGNATDYGMDANVRGDRPPLLLHFTVGDPDLGQALAFRKVQIP
jgi:hypothetical protein